MLWSAALGVIAYMLRAYPDASKGIPKMLLSFLYPNHDKAAPASTRFDAQWLQARAVGVLRAGLRSFGAGYGLRVAIALVGFVMSPRMSVKAVVDVLFGRQHMALGSFFGSMTVLYSVVRHVLHYVRGQDDAVNCAVAGMGYLCCL